MSRRHWALVEIGFVGGATVAAAVVYGLGLSWWMGPLSHAGLSSRLSFPLFDQQGVVPVVYTFFAVALGIFAGAMWPKMLPALAFTPVGFIGLRVALTVLARPNYLPASTHTYPVVSSTSQPEPDEDDWILGVGVRNPDGTLVHPNVRMECLPDGQGPGRAECGSELGIEAGAYNWQLYQPAGRFWLFQGIETGIFVVLGCGVAGTGRAGHPPDCLTTTACRSAWLRPGHGRRSTHPEHPGSVPELSGWPVRTGILCRYQPRG